MRLIDADKVAEAIAWLDEYDFVIWHDVQECIDKVPTVDAEPVRHGRWVVIDDKPFYDCKCSECGASEYFEHGYKWYNYCPNCGAKMDERREDD